MNFGPFRGNIPTSLGDLQDEMNRVFDRFWHGGVSTGPLDGKAWAPVFDVSDEADRVLVTAELPGLDAPEVEVSFLDGKLTLKGHKTSPWTDEAARKLYRGERRYGSFSRSIELPEGIDPESISATMKHGVLTVTVRKTPQKQGKTIRIDAAN